MLQINKGALIAPLFLSTAHRSRSNLHLGNKKATRRWLLTTRVKLIKQFYELLFLQLV